MVEAKKPEVQRMVFRESPLGKFVVQQLSGIGYINSFDPKGSLTSLKEKVGEKHYPDYEELVLRRVLYFSTRNKERRNFQLKLIEVKEQLMKESDIGQNLILEARTRAKAIWEDWIEQKSAEFEGAQGYIGGGNDPNVYLGDGSHRNGLGYYQSPEIKS